MSEYTVTFEPARPFNSIPAEYTTYLCKLLEMAMTDPVFISKMPDSHLAHTIEGTFVISSPKHGAARLRVEFVLSLRGDGSIIKPSLPSVIGTIISRYWRTYTDNRVVVSYSGPEELEDWFTNSVIRTANLRNVNHIKHHVREGFLNHLGETVMMSAVIERNELINFEIYWDKDELRLSANGARQFDMTFVLGAGPMLDFSLLNLHNATQLACTMLYSAV